MSPILLLLIFFLTTFISQSLGDNEQVNKYLDCFYPFECGNFTANYPFWGAHRPQSCGHPLLELRCEDHKRPIILLGGVKYKIHHINEKSKILKISRADYQDGFCNPQLQNTTLLSPILNYYNYSETEMIIFFYNCPSVSDQSTASPELSSPLESTEKAMVQFNCSDKHGLIMKNNSHVPQDCLSNLAVPVNKSFISQWLDDLSLLQRGLREGFEVKWNDSGQECEKCKKFNNGSCAYDLENSKMVCYCLDDQSGLVTTACPASQESPAPSGTKKRVMLKWIGIGIATGFVAAVSLGVISILIMRRCKRKKEEQFMDEDWETQPTITKTTTTLTKYYSKSSPGYCSSRSNNGKRRSYFGAQVFNHFELEEATNSFDSSNELGGGGFGTVYHGVLKDGQEVAIKRLYEHSSKRVQQFLTEIQILARLSYPNLAKLYGCTSRHSRELLLVYEYIPNGTLGDHLHGRNSNLEFLTWSTRLSIAIDAADALAYLHASNVIHRDVKTSNMLLNEKLHVKVVDFGLSRLFPNDVSHISTAPQGTPGYVDPDYYHCYKLTDKSDVYSFGVVLVELISSLPAVDTNRIKHDINLSSMAITRIQNHELDEMVDPDLGFETDYKVRKMIMLVAELAFRCLQQEKEFRPSMQEVAEVLREIQNNETNGNIKAEKVGSCDTHDKVVLLNNGSSSSSHDSTRRSF